MAPARLNAFIGYFVVIDLLLLPYIQAFIVPISLPIVLFSFLWLNIKLSKDFYFKIFVGLCVVVTLSLVISFIVTNEGKWVAENIKRAGQLLSSFLYFFFFRWIAERSHFNPSAIIWVFIVWFSGLGLLFFVDPLLSNSIIQGMYGRLVVSEEVVLFNFRYAYIFNDPNTAGYFYLIALAALFLFEKKNQKRTNFLGHIHFLILCVLSAFAIAVTQSLGALIALVTILLLSLFHNVSIKTLLSSVKSIFIVLVFVSVGYLAWVYFLTLAEENVVFYRLFEKAFSGENEHTVQYRAGGGNRFQIWEETLENFGFPYPIGRGAVLLVEGEGWGPHSDTLHYLYSYGFFGLVMVMTFFFRPFVGLSILIVPAFIAFSINSLVGEQKLLALYLSFLGVFLAAPRFTEDFNNRNLASST